MKTKKLIINGVRVKNSDVLASRVATNVLAKPLRGIQAKLSAAIKAKRLSKGWTMEELAARAGCTRSQICYMESSKRFGEPATIDAVLDALDISILFS